jgi:hypothetical protein
VASRAVLSSMELVSWLLVVLVQGISQKSDLLCVCKKVQHLIIFYIKCRQSIDFIFFNHVLNDLIYWGMHPVARVSIKYQNTSLRDKC